jgi:hypothetical protein
LAATSAARLRSIPTTRAPHRVATSAKRPMPHTDIEHEFAFQFLWSKAGFDAEIPVRFAHFIVIELGCLIAVPLETETGGVMLRVHKTRNPSTNGYARLQAGHT